MPRRSRRPANPTEETPAPPTTESGAPPTPGAPADNTSRSNWRPNLHRGGRHPQGGAKSAPVERSGEPPRDGVQPGQPQRRRTNPNGRQPQTTGERGANQGNRARQPRRDNRPAAPGAQTSAQTGERSPQNTSGAPRGTRPGDRRRQPNRPDSRRNVRPAARQEPSRSQADRFPPATTPRKARGGIRARSENGEFGKNWWAKRWLLAMERLMDGARLARGRRYARIGQVLSMNEADGGVVARVQGSRPAPYKVTIRVAPLADEQWEKVLDVLADRAIFTAQLLAGEMPANIEDAFSAADVSLFPNRGGDLMTECSCPDWANPCKHIAATHYILADRFDEDPFLLFRMRGRTQDEILQALRQRRAGQEELPPEEPVASEPVEPLENQVERFWDIGVEMDAYSVNVQAPAVALPLLTRLGDPDFASRHPLSKLLSPAYDVISQAALFLAFSDTTREEPESNGEGDGG